MAPPSRARPASAKPPHANGASHGGTAGAATTAAATAGAAAKPVANGKQAQRPASAPVAGKKPAPAAPAAAAAATAAPEKKMPKDRKNKTAALAAVMNSNWNVIKAKIGSTGAGARKHAAAVQGDDSKTDGSKPGAAAGGPAQGGSLLSMLGGQDNSKHVPQLTPCLGLDCEMVGVGDGTESVLAQVCIINYSGEVVYISYVKTIEAVTDYRTQWSGIRKHHLKDAKSFKEVQAEVAAIIDKRTIVGHALHNDLKVLQLSHPHRLIRDTAKYPPFCYRKRPGGKLKPRKLRDLASQLLSITIQSGEHNPAEDAQAAMLLYKKYRKEWEHSLRTKTAAPSIAFPSKKKKQDGSNKTVADAEPEGAAAPAAKRARTRAGSDDDDDGDDLGAFAAGGVVHKEAPQWAKDAMSSTLNEFDAE